MNKFNRTSAAALLAALALSLSACGSGNVVDSDGAPIAQPTSSQSQSPIEATRNGNGVEEIPGWPIDESSKESTIILEADQTPEELARDFVQSLESIYNANLQEARDKVREDIENDPNSVNESLQMRASENAGYTVKSLLEQLLPADYEESPNLTAFKDDIYDRILFRTWVYAWTDPSGNLPIESEEVGDGPESLVTEDVFRNVEVIHNSKDVISLAIDADSTPLNLKNTPVRNNPDVYNKVNEGSVWTSSVTFKKRDDDWMIVEIDSHGSAKYK